jgi:hypothetical protein
MLRTTITQKKGLRHLERLAFDPEHFEEICFVLVRTPEYYFQTTSSSKTVFEEFISTLTPKPPARRLGDAEFRSFFSSIVRFSFHHKGRDPKNFNDIIIVYLFQTMLQMEIFPLSIAINLLSANLVLHCLNILAIAYNNKTLTRREFANILFGRNEEWLTPLHFAIKNNSAIVKYYLSMVNSVLAVEENIIFNSLDTKSGDSYLDWIQYYGNDKILQLYLEYLLNVFKHDESTAWEMLFNQAKANHAARKLEDQDNKLIKSLRALGSYDGKTRPILPFFNSPKKPDNAAPVNGWEHPCARTFNYKVFGPELLPCDGPAYLHAGQNELEDWRESHSLRL